MRVYCDLQMVRVQSSFLEIVFKRCVAVKIAGLVKLQLVHKFEFHRTFFFKIKLKLPSYHNHESLKKKLHVSKSLGCIVFALPLFTFDDDIWIVLKVLEFW